MTYVPLMIHLAGRKIVVIGGGNVAGRRMDVLRESGASLHVVSPSINDRLFSLWQQGVITWQKKTFESDDIHGAALVIAATDDPQTNQEILKNTGKNTLLNMTGSAEEGNVIFPGTYRQGRLVFSVSTEGASPMLASKILNDFKSEYDERYEQYVDFLYECRKHLKKAALSKAEQNKWLSHLLSDEYLEAEKQKEMFQWLKTL